MKPFRQTNTLFVCRSDLKGSDRLSEKDFTALLGSCEKDALWKMRDWNDLLWLRLHVFLMLVSPTDLKNMKCNVTVRATTGLRTDMLVLILVN